MDFIGNQKVVKALANGLEKGSLNHAYIFSGPQHVGKFTLAKMFALGAIAGRNLNMDVSQEDKDALLDLIVIRPEIIEKNKISKQRDISIEKIREAKLSLSLFPYHGKYKVLIIEDAHRMNTAAQNALLKVLEEPNQTTIMILVTHELDRILPTILSRCQVVNFSLVDDADISESFGSQEIAVLSTGRPGMANLLCNSDEEKNFRLQAQDQFERIISGSLNEKFSIADECSKDIMKTLEKLNIWMWQIRKKTIDGNDEQRREAFTKIEKIQASANMLKRTNANSKLILEVLFMDM